MCVCVCVYIYIYIEREREREREASQVVLVVKNPPASRGNCKRRGYNC